MVSTRSMTKKMQEQQQEPGQEQKQEPKPEQTQKKQIPRTSSLYKEKKWRKPAGWMWGRWMPVANGARR